MGLFSSAGHLVWGLQPIYISVEPVCNLFESLLEMTTLLDHLRNTGGAYLSSEDEVNMEGIKGQIKKQ